MTALDLDRGPEVVVARYGELWLKGKNRHVFERELIRNVRHAVEEISPVRVERGAGQIAVFPEKRVEDVARRMQDVFGLSSISPVWGAESDADAICETARVVVAQALERFPRNRPITFRVETKRSHKRFPMNSMELDRYVADRVLPDHDGRFEIQLVRPELTLGISVRAERTYLFAERLAGGGGLPVGTLGRGLCLLSGGIDSPVAAWLAMKRGCQVSFVSFHSYPYIGESSKRKIERLAQLLMRFQRKAQLFSVPFTRIQEAIRDACKESYRTVLYRRMMQRIASRIAAAKGAGALITGESLGQVASQTLENLTCIEAASELPVLRPLVCFDKTETIELARRVGTFETSIEPEPDCCTVFQPKKPIIRGRLEECEAEEALIDVEELVGEAVEGAQVMLLGS